MPFTILDEYRRLGLRPISGGEGDPPANPDPAPDPEPEIPGLGDAGKEALRREREARKAEAARAKAAEDRLAALEKAESDREAAKAKADEEEAARRGEFERLATERQAALDALKAHHDTLTATVKAYEDRERQRIESGLADLPDDLKAFDPGPDAPLDARAAWFDKAAGIAAERATTQPAAARMSPTPLPSGPGATELRSLVSRQQAGYG